MGIYVVIRSLPTAPRSHSLGSRLSPTTDKPQNDKFARRRLRFSHSREMERTLYAEYDTPARRVLFEVAICEAPFQRARNAKSSDTELDALPSNVEN